MSLATAFTDLSDQITQTINELITQMGTTSEYNGGSPVLDLRAFAFSAENQNTPYWIEMLVGDNHPVEYITSRYAYANGLSYDLSSLVENNIEALCEALDVLVEHGPVEYTVILRAIVTIDDEHLPECFEFPEAWDVYDKSGDDELTLRLDTVMTVSANTKDDAMEVALANPPSLGFTDEINLEAESSFWIDEDQDDNVTRVLPE